VHLSFAGKKKNEIREMFRVKTDPSTLSGVLTAVSEIKLNRYFKWLDIMVELNSLVRRHVDEWGLVGLQRATYYDFSKSLWKHLSKYPMSCWDRYIDGVIDYYVKIHGANREYLKVIADEVVNFLKGLMKRIEREAEVGSTGVEVDNSK
jgi:hypothetical protein